MAKLSSSEQYGVEVVFEHQDFFVVSKQPNIGFHDETDEKTRQAGFFNQVCETLNESLYPVHRLDKITSGLLILARNKETATWFQQAFEAKTINKLYLAVVSKKPKKKQGSIIGDMSKARSGQWKLIGSKQNPAVTRFFSFGVEGSDSSIRYVLLKPETGKTHQIRVALKSIGAPILGDTLYGGESADRGYLHAFALKFDYLGQTINLVDKPRHGEQYLAMPNTVLKKIENGFNLKWPTGN